MKKDEKLEFEELRKELMELRLQLEFKRMAGEGQHKSTFDLLKRIELLDRELTHVLSENERGKKNDRY